MMLSTLFIVNDFLKVADKRAHMGKLEIRNGVWGVESEHSSQLCCADAFSVTIAMTWAME
jgi:hypothetical protein